MIQLTPQNIRIGARAASKNEAIRAAGQVLVESGFIEPGYIESMIGREGQANTYLGNGISIPHGMAKDRELIRATGISVVQLPDGVEWGPGKVAHLIVGIAAKSDEHLGCSRRSRTCSMTHRRPNCWRRPRTPTTSSRV